MEKLLDIQNLNVSFPSWAGPVQAVRGVSLSVDDGEIVALVGESGCGKSVTAQTVLRLLPESGVTLSADRLHLGGLDLLTATERQLTQARGQLAAMVFQDPMTSLDPTMRVGAQLTETLQRRQGLSSAQCRAEAVRLLELVRIPDAALRARQYPHQFSGGMRQRALLAMALAGRPRLLIADEPTTALDVTTQLQILLLLRRLRDEQGTAVLLITHDLSVVANLADRIAVMYAGRIVEQGPAADLLTAPAHPYTAGLLESLPSPAAAAAGRLPAIPGTPPDLSAPPPGCGFAPRCRHCMQLCRREAPPLLSPGPGRLAACWRLHPAYPGKGANA